MARRKKSKSILGKLEIEIMDVLWLEGSATARQVFESVGGANRYAYTTILSMMRHLEAKGAASHTVDGRTHVYRAEVAREDVSTSMVNELVSNVFGGSALDLVNAVIGSGALSEAELSDLEATIDSLRKRGSDD